MPPAHDSVDDHHGSPAVEQGEQAAVVLADLDDDAIAVLYEQVRAVARRFRGKGFHSDSLVTTDLAQETLLKAFGRMLEQPFESHQHLINTLSKVMYRLLCERLRRRKARQKHLQTVPLLDHDAQTTSDIDWLLDFTEHLEVLEHRRNRAAEVLRLRAFFQMSLPEMAEALGCSPAAAQRELAFGRVFLRRRGCHTDDGPAAIA